MRINKYYNQEKVYSMRDLSEILSIEKSEIKNSVRSFNLIPTIVENKIWYFGTSILIEFIEYLILKENLRLIKTRIKKYQF